MPDTIALTTKDNPFNPFTEFSQWMSYDHFKGYNTCELLARVCFNSNNLSEADQELEFVNAINELVLTDPYDNLQMVTVDTVDKVLSDNRERVSTTD